MESVYTTIPSARPECTLEMQVISETDAAATLALMNVKEVIEKLAV